MRCGTSASTLDVRSGVRIDFPSSFSFNQNRVKIHLIEDDTVKSIDFSPKLFDYGKTQLTGESADDIGFSGFRVHYPLNRPDYLDELIVFQGASYFRALGQQQRYGLSARGLAVDAGVQGVAEEFPFFEQFWIERPLYDAKQIKIYALMDSPSVVGAYQFTIMPGTDTVIDVKEALFFRKSVSVLGIAPLTSMFWYGKTPNFRSEDFRPEVHDSDGFLTCTGTGEWLWRPLVNDGSLRYSAFLDTNPKGFGLIQRERQFENYQDLEACYHLRPSVWIEPVGDWGKGSVRLVEMPANNEIHDNVVAFWEPERHYGPGDTVQLEYRIYWMLNNRQYPSAGRCIATRLSSVSEDASQEKYDPSLKKFVLDFGGAEMPKIADDSKIDAAITVGPGAQLVGYFVQKNPFNGSWRVVFTLRHDKSATPVELRCFLKEGDKSLTETWTYLWKP